jgi:hypothetical protein
MISRRERKKYPRQSVWREMLHPPKPAKPALTKYRYQGWRLHWAIETYDGYPKLPGVIYFPVWMWPLLRLFFKEPDPDLP